jgi:hypothetical protein
VYSSAELPASKKAPQIVVLMPVYQDWDSASAVCAHLDKQVSALNIRIRILLVDDGSPEGIEGWSPFRPSAIDAIETLRLRTNIGHQRAICVGLCYIYDHIPCDFVVVMDSDGEDRPEDVATLLALAHLHSGSVIFAERRKRQEALQFRIGYTLFRTLHRILTGIPVRVGNFSVVPYLTLTRLTCMPELWNHFAGAVYRSKAPFQCAPIDRGRRLRGRSHMNLPALVAHGLAGIATFHTIVATRILISTAVCLLFTSLALFAVASVRLLTTWAVTGWATYTAGLVLILGVQLAAMAFGLVFTLISNRTSMPFIPSRDYTIFVDKVRAL